MDSVKRSYFFWGDTYDGHPGLVGKDGKKTDAYHALTSVTGTNA